MSLEELKYFFSYARNDSEFVLKLAKELRAVGANLWLDQLDILGGQHWDSTVEKALKSCKGMIAVLSPESVASDNVMDEVSYALNEGKLVVPVLIRPCNIPYRLQRVQYIDFTADYDTGFSQLLRALSIEQPLQPVESAATQEPVVRDSTEPLEEKPTEPLVLEKQAAQEVEKPIPDEIDHPKPTGLETEKAGSMSQKTKVIAAICIVALIAIVLIVIFRKYLPPKTYSLTATADPNGSVTKSPDRDVYKHGDEVTLKAVPNPGYSFKNWSGALSNSNNPVELVIMDVDKSVKASFVKTYSLTATADPNGSVTKSPDRAVYKHGDEVTLKAVPNPGYSFKNWSGALSDSNNPVELVIMDVDKSVKANFALKTHSLDIPQAVGGSVKKDPDQVSYNHGETVTLEAVPNTGYSFENWSGALDGSTNPAELVMNADKSVTASFALKTYRLDIPHAVGGSVTKDPNQASYNHGETVILKAVPNMGYGFTNWSGDLSGSSNPATLEMDADKSVKANFALKTYSLTILALDGSVTKDPNKVSYKDGETVILKADPNTGYSFTNWSGDLDGSTNPATLVMTANKSVFAHFVKTYNLTILALDGSVTKDPNKVSYKDGETVILGAKPNEGYSFMNWSGDLDGSTNPATLVMDADKSVTASFGLNVVTNSIGMKLVYIPPGSFTMGCSSSAAQLAREYNTKEDYFTNEIPQHQVRISKGFWMGQTEVTQGQYTSVMNAQPWSAEEFVQESANNPAVYVSWDDAVEFCRKLSKKEGKTYRLPTEAEWEYACRAGTTTRFSFGDSDSSLGNYAWCRSNAYEVGQKYAHSVGQKKPNPCGLYDMHGNVWEWCSDWYAKDYYSKSLSVDPKGPSSGTTRRSLRGGSWNLVESNLRCSVRDYYNPINRYSSVIGFRVVRSQ